MPVQHLLRTSRAANSPHMNVQCQGAECHLELTAGIPLLAGSWSAELQVDGKTVTPPQEWDEVLWYEDPDVAYLELDADLGDSWRLQRHILLARLEGFVLLADAILGPRSAKLSYRSQIPLAEKVVFQPDSEGNEGRLIRGTKRFLALPLGLPEWRVDRPRGELSASEGLLTLTAGQTGGNLFAPLLIPLVSRGKVNYTWRPLAVAESLEIQAPDAAFAARVQVGDRQWVTYRALTRGNRTFLGKNLISEFFCGVFHKTGEMDAIMEVE